MGKGNLRGLRNKKDSRNKAEGLRMIINTLGSWRDGQELKSEEKQFQGKIEKLLNI